MVLVLVLALGLVKGSVQELALVAAVVLVLVLVLAAAGVVRRAVRAAVLGWSWADQPPHESSSAVHISPSHPWSLVSLASPWAWLSRSLGRLASSHPTPVSASCLASSSALRRLRSSIFIWARSSSPEEEGVGFCAKEEIAISALLRARASAVASASALLC